MQQVGDDIGVQIVIVDDASSDGSWAVAARLRDQYPQWVKLIGLDVNQGVSAARNRLIAEAEGEYIWFVDPDDYLLAGALGALRVIVAESAPDLILCDYRKSRLVATRSFYGTAKQLSTDIGQLVAGVFKSRKMYCWLKISRRCLWANGLRFPDGKIFEDIATTPWLLLKARHFYYMPSPWIHYRRRAGSIMDSVKRKTGIFEARKHKDLAEALTGFKEALHGKLGQLQPSNAYYVSDFCAKEFVKTGLRFARAADVDPSLTLRLYLDLFEKCSPFTFDHLTIEYLKRLRFVRYVLLKYALHVAKASQKSTEGDNDRAQ
jgi:glycosyltransferase involved in cell wall biosynthesis